MKCLVTVSVALLAAFPAAAAFDFAQGQPFGSAQGGRGAPPGGITPRRARSDDSVPP